MSKLQLILGVLLCAIFACKKVETPPPSTENPVFSIEGNLDGETLNIVAGEGDYYLFTSHEIDDQNVHSFVATFAKIDCLDACQDTFRIKIRDAQQSSQNGVNINDVLLVGDYGFKGNQQVFTVEMDTIYNYTSIFDASSSTLPNVGNSIFTWQVGTETFTSFLSILAINLDYQPNETVFVSLKIDNPIFPSYQEAQLVFGVNGLTKECYTEFETMPAPTGQQTMLIANPIGAAPFTYTWSDGSTNSSVLVDTASYTLTVTDANGCTNESVVGMSFNLNSISSQANFSISTDVSFTVETDTIFTTDPFQFSTVTIEYVDENGAFYSSELASQPANSVFSITAVDDYQNNENGEKTKQLSVEFDCILGSNLVLPALQLTGGKGKIAVAYPN